MSREIYGLIIGISTLLIIFLPLKFFFFFILLLSYFIGRELSEHLNCKELSFPSFFAPAFFYTDFSLGAIYVFLISFLYAYKNKSLNKLFISVFILSYTGFFLSYLIRIKEEGTYLILIFILSIWANDVFAYYVGKRFGKTPLFKDISPKKTLEGFSGGLFAGLLTFTLLSPFPFLKSLIIGIIFLTLAVFGDYFKSFIKRQLRIKDFSNVFGEHGGFTDRFDAVIFSGSVYYYLVINV